MLDEVISDPFINELKNRYPDGEDRRLSQLHLLGGNPFGLPSQRSGDLRCPSSVKTTMSKEEMSLFIP